MEIFKLSAVFGVVLAWCTVTWTLDMEGSVEGSCFPVKPVATAVDSELLYTQSFYEPMLSRSKLYRVIAQLLEPMEPSEINEGSIYYDACLRWQFSENSSIARGYGGRKETIYAATRLPESSSTVFRPSEGVGGYSGTAWNTKTDNKTYMVEATCSDDNHMEWEVLSIMPVLPPWTVKEIKQHLVEIGFKEAYFTSLRYDNCPKENHFSL